MEPVEEQLHRWLTLFLPHVSAGQQQESGVLRLKSIDREVGSDFQSAHGYDRLRRESDAAHVKFARTAQLAQSMRRLPVSQAVEHQHVHSLLHRVTSLVYACTGSGFPASN